MSKCVVYQKYSEALNDINIINYQFIAYVYSTWHLDNVMANMLIKGVTKGLIFVLPLELKRFVKANFDHPVLSNCTIVELRHVDVKCDYFLLKRRIFEKNSQTIHIFNSMGVDLYLLLSLPLRNNHVDYLIFDEGTGSYFPKFIIKQSRYNNFLWTYVNITFKEMVKNIMVWLTDIKITKSLLFVKRKNTYSLNISLTEALSKVYSQYTKAELDIPVIENSVILFKDANLGDVEFYKKIFSLIPKNYQIYVKLHPMEKREEFSKLAQEFNCLIIPNAISGEYVVNLLKPKYVIGGVSTVVYTSSAIFGCNVVSLYYLYIKYNYINRYVIYDRLNKCLDRKIEIIDTMEQLAEVIK